MSFCFPSGSSSPCRSYSGLGFTFSFHSLRQDSTKQTQLLANLWRSGPSWGCPNPRACSTFTRDISDADPNRQPLSLLHTPHPGYQVLCLNAALFLLCLFCGLHFCMSFQSLSRVTGLVFFWLKPSSWLMPTGISVWHPLFPVLSHLYFLSGHR